MHRISSDKDYYSDGKIVIDADGIPIEPASKDYVDQRVPIGSFAGAGSPERKVAAPVGSIYTDTAATNGAIRWIKTSGTGSTGWRVEYGYTGGRKISDAFSHLTSASSRHISIARHGNMVDLVLHNVVFDLGEVPKWTSIITIPAGFRPRAVFRDLLTNPVVEVELSPNGVFRTGDTPISQGTSLYFRLQWTTEDAWPATLPGVPY